MPNLNSIVNRSRRTVSLSVYMTGSYTYNNRYTFFGSLRYDGSNMFGVDRKYKYLPLWAVSGAWNINREAFLSDADWLSDLKLRASYGVQGNVDKEYLSIGCRGMGQYPGFTGQFRVQYYRIVSP